MVFQRVLYLFADLRNMFGSSRHGETCGIYWNTAMTYLYTERLASDILKSRATIESEPVCPKQATASITGYFPKRNDRTWANNLEFLSDVGGDRVLDETALSSP